MSDAINTVKSSKHDLIVPSKRLHEKLKAVHAYIGRLPRDQRDSQSYAPLWVILSEYMDAPAPDTGSDKERVVSSHAVDLLIAFAEEHKTLLSQLDPGYTIRSFERVTLLAGCRTVDPCMHSFKVSSAFSTEGRTTLLEARKAEYASLTASRFQHEGLRTNPQDLSASAFSEYRTIRRELSGIVNVLSSVVAVGVAVYYALGNREPSTVR